MSVYGLGDIPPGPGIGTGRAAQEVFGGVEGFGVEADLLGHCGCLGVGIDW